jgi:two-component system NarL family response regulator
MTIRIVLADDHRLLRDGLKALLFDRDDIQVVGEAEDGQQAMELARTLSPDVVVMDLGMRGMNGIEATKRIVEASPGVRVLALSTHADKRYVMNMVEAGASGYVLKSSATEDLVRALHAVASGRSYLGDEITGIVLERCRTPEGAGVSEPYAVLAGREREVLQLLAEGLTSKEIAVRLHLATKTIETHRGNIMKKLRLRTVAQLTKYAVREGLTSLED